MRAFALALLLFPFTCWGWGQRGHRVICEAAVHLVSEPKLRDFLIANTGSLIHLCLIPDIQWRAAGKAIRQSNFPTHFMAPERLGFTVGSAPEDLKTIKRVQLNLLGTNWWRAEQFYRRASRSRSTPRQFLENIGLLGHFVGDNGQPLHSTADFDGVAAQLPGLHERFETEVVNSFGPELLGEVTQAARAQIGQAPAFLTGASAQKLFRALSAVSVSELPLIIQADKARDRAALKALVVIELARSAAQLAELWRRAHEAIGSPLQPATQLPGFPFRVPYVWPDYLPAK